MSAASPPVFDRDAPCPFCGYNLRGLPHIRCPECGVVATPADFIRRPRLQLARLISLVEMGIGALSVSLLLLSHLSSVAFDPIPELVLALALVGMPTAFWAVLRTTGKFHPLFTRGIAALVWIWLVLVSIPLSFLVFVVLAMTVGLIPMV